MSDELLINESPGETRVALVESGLLQEVHFERSRSRNPVNNIYCGRVLRVLPGMQAAFVDIGQERSGFLHADDVLNPSGEQDHLLRRIRPGQTVLVQVIKAPLGSKGARLTTRLSLSSRYLVYSPRALHIGVSQRIEDESERQRLRELVEAGSAEFGIEGGFILRTAAEGARAQDVQADMKFLHKRWLMLEQSLPQVAVPGLAYSELPLALRALRDIARPGLERIRIDSQDYLAQAREFAATYSPELLELIQFYQDARPLFDMYSIEDEIRKALNRVVPLKSGGHIVIEQTEAMTTIDVNTGTFVGRSNLEETIFKTNLEAATALARQLRLRNLGGIVIVDFIDMASEDHRRQVLRTLERALEKDRAKTSVSGVSALGLVEITRKRTSESLAHLLETPCPACSGTGRTKSLETLCLEVFREVVRESRQFDQGRILILAGEKLADYMQEEESDRLAELQDMVRRPVDIRAEAGYLSEQYDIIPV